MFSNHVPFFPRSCFLASISVPVLISFFRCKRTCVGLAVMPFVLMTTLIISHKTNTSALIDRFDTVVVHT